MSAKTRENIMKFIQIIREIRKRREEELKKPKPQRRRHHNDGCF